MKRVIGLLAFALFTGPARAENTIRHYLAYADSTLVDLAHSTGRDPLAAIGREIPSAVTLRVPSQSVGGGRFKVQLWMEYTRGEDARLNGNTNTFNVAYDRALGSAGSGFRIDEFSFQKLAIGTTVPQDSLSNYGHALAFNNAGSPVDANGDGIQDTSTFETLQDAQIHSTYVPGTGVSVRPYGLAGYISARNDLVRSAPAFRNYAIGSKQHIVDLSFRSKMNAGETYGFAEGETGLTVFVNDEAADSRVTGFYPFPATVHNIGTKYNLFAVPEPAPMIAVLVGFGVLVRRRK